jgi:HEPN domain-containing protein
MQPDPARVADTKAWLTKASSDIRSAEVASAAEPPLLSDAAFHCQQATEKALKGFLAWHDRPFRKTHSLVELGGQCAELDAELEPLLRRAAPLTAYATEYRYPGGPDDPPPEEVAAALSLAREVCEAVAARLPEAALP